MNDHQLSFKTLNIIKNYTNIEKRSFLFIFLPGLHSLNHVHGYEREFGQEIVFVTFDKIAYEILTDNSYRAILCNPFTSLKGLQRYLIIPRILHRWKYNNSVLKLLNEEIVDNSTFILNIRIINYWGVLIAKYLFISARKVELIYLRKNEIFNNYQTFDIKKLYYQLIDSLSYKLKLKWFFSEKGLGIYLGVSEDYLKSFSIRFVDDESFILDSTSRFENKEDSTAKSINRLILGGSSISVEKNFYDTQDVIEIYRITKKRYPDTFHKYHPGKIIKDALSDSFFQIDNEIPIEIINYEIKVLIGGFSTALISMSLRGVKCVSYMKLVNPTKNFDRDFFIKDMLIKSNNKIHFPDTMGEYLEIIK